MLKAKRISMLTIFMLIMSIISTQVYAEKIPFTDVSEKSWYYDDVKSAYESNLINGKKADKYAPDDNMTAAEAVKLAAAMHKLKNEGKVDFTSSKPWYKVYVDYAKEKNLITDDLDWNKKITRAGYMQIFAQILTDEESKKNSVADGSIPDVPMTHQSAKAIYKLYRAGVVVGVDDKRNCSPGSNIKRSEVAAILIRMMDVKRRLSFSIEAPAPGTTPPGTTPPATTALKITKQPENAKGKVGDIVTLEVKVEGGKEPYNYQWKYRKVGDRDYTNSKSEGNTTNVLKPPVENDTYDYRCVIKDADGKEVTSAEARVEKEVIASPLRITKHPENAKGKEGDIVTLEVMVEGGKQPYRYQWEYTNRFLANYKNSIAEGNTTNVLKPPVEAVENLYRCVVTDANGDKIISNVGTVKLDLSINPLRVTKHPEDASGYFGKPITLEVEVAGGKAPYSYQWESRTGERGSYKNCYLEGSKTNRLIANILDEPSYWRCVIKDANGTLVISNPAKLVRDIEPSVLKITKQPKDAYGNVGGFVTLEVQVEGGIQPYKYQWEECKFTSPLYSNSTAEGNTTNILKVPILEDAYVYKCTITDEVRRSVTTRVAKVAKIDIPFRFVEQPRNQQGKLGERVALEVKVEGGKAPYSYQWQYRKDGTVEYYNSTSEGNTASILKPPVENDIYYYKCVITDASGEKITTYEAKVERKLEITKQPKDAYGKVGDRVTLEVQVDGGKKPYRYQWSYRGIGESSYKNSTSEGNATNVLRPPVEHDYYWYVCDIMDANGEQLVSKEVLVYKR
ncbi:immunoglobulin domain-containing protein [Peptostreptococcaceae bacterium oral taxon 081]|nr:immunoglobulin domain-containing protein [Peptostreptococcaceae bacterium oral taxon 081]